MNIAILGDSFSSDTDTDSWVTLLGKNHNVCNFSQRGISQFRIYKIFLSNIEFINSCDRLILWDTNPYRIYLNDNVDYPTRDLTSHPYADMITSDVMIHKEWSKIAKTYYKYFFDEEQQDTFSKLLINEMLGLIRIPVVRCTGFDINNPGVKSFFDIKQQHNGTINHMDATGNKLVLEYIQGEL